MNKKLSLARKFPSIASEADGWDPSEVLPGSNKVQKWICAHGHKWEVSPNNRTQKSTTGCPYCSGKRPVKGENDFATLHPSIASQSDGWDPYDYLPKSNKKLKWKCSKGHCWLAAICDRVDGDGCPVCSNRILIETVNDLETLHPDLARQANGWDPKSVIGGGHAKRRWKCVLGHDWEAQVNKRINGQGCPTCSGQKVEKNYNSLAVLSPIIAAQAFGWDPTSVTIRSGRNRKWKCLIGHIYEATVDKRSSGRGCPVCSGKKVLPGYNDLKTVHPLIAIQADGWDPTTVTSKSNKKFRWKCENNHSWLAQVGGRTSGKGCPICSNRIILVGFNDLKTKCPEVAKQAFGWNPAEFVYGSHSKAEWICHLGHKWTAAINERAVYGTGCPTCAGLVLLKGFNDLQTIAPHIAEQAAGWNPSAIKAGSSEKLAWKCSLDHRWMAQVNSRVGGRGCPICSGKAVLFGYNDLITTHPVLASQAHNWNPSSITMGSDKKFDWICDEGHIWNASVSKRVSGRGCPSCAKSGFDQGQDGWLYLIEHDQWNLFKIGITNNPDDRLQRHMTRGWEFLEIRGPMVGLLTLNLETEILRSLFKRGAKFANRSGFERFDGWSEAWTKLSLLVASIRQLLDWVYEDEGILIEEGKK